METDSEASSYYRTNKLISNSDNPDSMETEESDKPSEKEVSQEKESKDEDSSEKESTSSDNKGKGDRSDDTKENYKNPTAAIRQFKNMYNECSRENIRLHQVITSLQEQQHGMSLKV